MRSTVLVLLAACGRGGEGGPSPSDAAQDSAVVTIDAPPPTDVDVTTYVRCCGSSPPLTPQTGVVVVAMAPNGDVIDGISDSAGHVTLANVHANSTLYVGYAESDALTTTLVTVFGVNPGVHLVFGEKYAGWDAHGTAGSMTVNLPAYSGADGYRVSSRCSSIPSTSPMITVPINARCQTATTPLAAIALQGGLPIATSYAPDAQFTPGSVYNAGAWIPSMPITESITGLNGVTKIDLEAGSVGTTSYDGTFISEVPVNGSATASLLAPRSAPALFAYADPGSPPSGMGKHDYIANAAINATQVSLVDPGIPWVGSMGFDDTKFYWPQTSGTYDAASVVARWARVDASSITHDLVWSVILPAGTTSFPAYPTLPPELDPFLVQPADMQHIYAPPFITLVDFSDAATYDAALANPEWVIAAPLNAGTGGDLSASVAIARSPQ